VETALELLQRKGRKVSSFLAQSPEDAAESMPRWTTQMGATMKAVSFMGNGFLAMSGYAGVMAGLLAVLKNALGISGLSHLLSVFQIFSSNSGGTWYSGLLAYSKDFCSLQETLGDSPSRAGELWNAMFFQNKGPALWGRSWRKTNEVIQMRAGLRNITLGNTTAMQDWATNKLWLAAVSIPTGSVKKPVRVSRSIAYRLVSKRIDLPALIPGVISVRLNSETGISPAPFSICGAASGPDCWGLEMLRTDGASLCGHSQTLPHLHPHPGTWSLTGVLTASSAAYGDGIIGATGSSKDAQKMSAWAVPGTKHPFRRGDYAALDAKEGSDPKLCQTYAIIDGSFTDNTGILNAVAAGVTEVTAFLNNFQLNKWLRPSYDKSSPTSIFQEDILELIQASGDRRTIHNVTDAYAKIDFVRIGVTTKRNKLFGTEQGRRVKLNLIMISGFLDDSWFSPALDSMAFGDLVQTITSAMMAAQHQDSVEWVLKMFFHVSLPSDWD